MSGTPLLSLAIWVPILAGFVVLATGSDRNAPLARMLALLGAIAGLLVTIPLYTGFDLHTPAMQFVELQAGFRVSTSTIISASMASRCSSCSSTASSR
jgi:NADH-quinone oxidoreductase subunit M